MYEVTGPVMGLVTHQVAGPVMGPVTHQILFLVLVLGQVGHSEARKWSTLSMDQSETCSTQVRRDDLAEGDYFNVQSDSSNGKSLRPRSPEECSLTFNFGDRRILVDINWECNEYAKQGNPFLAIYDNCESRKDNQITQLNCSRAKVGYDAVRTSGACVLLYHYRGKVDRGYYFNLNIRADKEIVAFPAGAIAAIIIGSIVGVLVLVKFFCVVTGWEKRLPDINLDPEDTKQILLNNDAALNSQGGAVGIDECEVATAGPGSSSRVCSRNVVIDSTQAGTSTSQLPDIGSLEILPPSRLKHYTSANVSKIWRR